MFCVVTLISLSLFVIVLVFKKIDRLYEMDKMISNIPTLPSKPIIGHMHLVLSMNCKLIWDNFVDISFEMNETFKLWMGAYLMIVVQDKSDLKSILQESEKPPFMKYSPTFLHTGILLADGTIT